MLMLERTKGNKRPRKLWSSAVQVCDFMSRLQPQGTKGSMDQDTPANCNQKSLKLCVNCHSNRNKETVKICQEYPWIPSTYPLLHWLKAKQHHNNPGAVYSSGSILSSGSKWGDIMSGIWDVLYSSKQALSWLDAGSDWAREMNCTIPTLSG